MDSSSLPSGSPCPWPPPSQEQVKRVRNEVAEEVMAEIKAGKKRARFLLLLKVIIVWFLWGNVLNMLLSLRLGNYPGAVFYLAFFCMWLHFFLKFRKERKQLKQRISILKRRVLPSILTKAGIHESK